jgi:dephospho-CoA kinase/inosine/xanthosine triphosphate pyrophosphatase family protein
MIRRPSLKEIFLSSERRIDLFFYTSSIEKYLQARAVLLRYGVQVRHFKGRTDPYSEDYSFGKEVLLAKAIEEILSSIGRTSLFFVEDTSLRIDALSESDVDYPGLAVKEWFRSTTFEQLDAELRRKNRGRAATVKSDIALHVPGLNRVVYFHGETSGGVVEELKEFSPSIQYPWLTPNTFNGWFVPDGANKVLGEMSFDESLMYDFRVKSLVKLVERLEEYTAALNLPAQSYFRIDRASHSRQLPLIPSVFLVVGPTCAGKSTFGEYAAQEFGFRWVEASDIVRMLIDERYGREYTHDASMFAERLLQEEGADVVARKVVSLLPGVNGEPLVITGFRTIEELELIRREIPDIKVVVLEASERTRYERYIRRSRVNHSGTLPEFKEHDSSQYKYGLLRVAEDFADIRVVNEGAIEDYRQQIYSVIFGSNISNVAGVSDQIHSARRSESSQLYRCLLALDGQERALDCGEIEALTGGEPIRFNNVNKILKRYPELAERIESARERVRYRITDAGRCYLRMLRPVVEGRKGKSMI